MELWLDIQERFYENQRYLKKHAPYYQYDEWLDGFDFTDIKKNRPYRSLQRRNKILAFGSRVLPKGVKNHIKNVIGYKEKAE